MCFPREFPSGWKTAERSGRKTVVFFVVNLRTKFTCVLSMSGLPRGSRGVRDRKPTKGSEDVDFLSMYAREILVV